MRAWDSAAAALVRCSATRDQTQGDTIAVHSGTRNPFSCVGFRCVSRCVQPEIKDKSPAFLAQIVPKRVLCAFDFGLSR